MVTALAPATICNENFFSLAIMSALFEKRLLLALGETVVSAFLYFVEYAVNLFLCGSLVGVVVPVGVARCVMLVCVALVLVRLPSLLHVAKHA